LSFARWFRVLATASLLVMTTHAAAAQKIANTGPKYDASGEVKVKGVVEDIREVPGAFEGTQLVVKTDTGTVLVHLAPADFLKEIESSFKKGDEVQVVGAKAPGSGEPEILAREITVGTNTTTLRDDKGVPVWAGWKPAKGN
jgi:DNA/RNA endonuclease YhcR with UshA esterase domain